MSVVSLSTYSVQYQAEYGVPIWSTWKDDGWVSSIHTEYERQVPLSTEYGSTLHYICTWPRYHGKFSSVHHSFLFLAYQLIPRLNHQPTTEHSLGARIYYVGGMKMLCDGCRPYNRFYMSNSHHVSSILPHK